MQAWCSGVANLHNAKCQQKYQARKMSSKESRSVVSIKSLATNLYSRNTLGSRTLPFFQHHQSRTLPFLFSIQGHHSQGVRHILSSTITRPLLVIGMDQRSMSGKTCVVVFDPRLLHRRPLHGPDPLRTLLVYCREVLGILDNILLD